MCLFDVLNSGIGDRITVKSFSGQVTGKEGSIATIDGSTNTTNSTQVDGASLSVFGLNIGIGSNGSITAGVSAFGGEGHATIDVDHGIGVSLGGSYTNSQGNVNGNEVRVSAGGVAAAVAIFYFTGIPVPVFK